MMLLLSMLSFAQGSLTISGVVTEKKTGEPIIGASILLKGQSSGTITDFNGNYSIPNVPSGATLVFSYIGMKTQEVKVTASSKLDISLEEDNQLIDEVVVIGYGIQRKSDLTGSVGAVKSKDLTKVATPNVANALQGRVSGVYISANGAPGSSPEVRIRGIGTTNNSNPLYVVDGMFMDDISFLSTHDIESMEVLKDASATAMYGSRGANGVIIVTTKQGTEGKAVVNFTASEGFQFNNSSFEMANATEYATLLNEALVNTGGKPKFDDPASLGKGTNWFDEIFRVASVRDYQLSVSGGSEKVRYNLSAGYYQQDGIITGNTYNRFTLRANNSYKISKRLTLGHNLSASFSHKKNENSAVVKAAYTISPVKRPYNEDGSFMDSESASSANPVATLHYTNNDDWKERIVGSAFLNWNILNGLDFKTSLGIDYIKWDHNKLVTEPGSRRSGRPAVHAQTLAVYNIFKGLKTAHPGLEIESCSSGGGRVDLGILEHADRIWVSDCVDPVERADIQRYTSLLVPPAMMGEHVGASPAHSTQRATSQELRMAMAFFGHMGIEWNLLKEPDEALAKLAVWVAEFKKHRDWFAIDTCVHADSNDPAVRLDGMVMPNRDAAIYRFTQLTTSQTYPAAPVHLPGLDPERTYRVSPLDPSLDLTGLTNGQSTLGWWNEEGVVLTGEALQRYGIRPPSLHPQQAVLLKAVALS